MGEWWVSEMGWRDADGVEVDGGGAVGYRTAADLWQQDTPLQEKRTPTLLEGL
jgi:hypothetical protein